jgi:type VI secretion system protein VasD
MRNGENSFGKRDAVFAVLIIFLCCSLHACRKKTPPPPPPSPEPARIVLEIQASGDINPNDEGRPSPVVLKIYQLRSAKKFLDADFHGLFQEDQSLLKKDFIQSEEIVVAPNGKQTLFFEPHSEAACIGILAAFRHFQDSEWRCSAMVIPNKFAHFFVTIKGNRVEIK